MAERSEGKKVRERHGADTEVREGWEEALQLPEQRSPLQPMVKQADCMHTMQDHTKADAHTAECGHPMLEQVDIPRRHSNLWRAQIEEFLLKEAAGHGGYTIEQDKTV